MKQLTCELCGGTEFVKQEGMFVCQSCGTKYSAEDAKNLMKEVEGFAPTPENSGAATGTANNGESAARLENYLSLAQGALDNSNNTEAESYSNKVLEVDQENYRAWMIKAQAAGWQTTLAKPRLDEALNCLQKAIECVPFELLEEEAKNASDIMQNLMLATALLKLDSVVSYPSNEGVNEVFKLKPDMMMKGIMVQAAYAGRIKAENAKRSEDDQLPLNSLDTLRFADSLDDKIFSAAIKMWNNMMAKYNSDPYPIDYVFEECTQTGVMAISLLNYLVPTDVTKVEPQNKAKVIKYCEQEISMKDTLSNMKSYTTSFSGGIESHPVSKCFLQSYKDQTAREIDGLRKIILQLDPNHSVPKTASEIQAEKQAEIKAKKAEKAANKNSGMPWLFGLIATVVFLLLNTIVGKILWAGFAATGAYRVYSITANIVSVIVFTIVAALTAFIGYKFIAKHKKNVKLAPVIVWSIILKGIFTLLLALLGDAIGSYAQVLVRFLGYTATFLVAVIVMAIADSKGTIIKPMETVTNEGAVNAANEASNSAEKQENSQQ